MLCFASVGVCIPLLAPVGVLTPGGWVCAIPWVQVGWYKQYDNYPQRKAKVIHYTGAPPPPRRRSSRKDPHSHTPTAPRFAYCRNLRPPAPRASLAHLTLPHPSAEGGPWFPDYRLNGQPYNKEWEEELAEYEKTLPGKRILCPYERFSTQTPPSKPREGYPNSDQPWTWGVPYSLEYLNENIVPKAA